jgi:hypothetical protein
MLNRTVTSGRAAPSHYLPPLHTRALTAFLTAHIARSSRVLTCPHVSSRVLTCPRVSSRVLTCPRVSSRVLACPHVSSRVLAYTEDRDCRAAHVCHVGEPGGLLTRHCHLHAGVPQANRRGLQTELRGHGWDRARRWSAEHPSLASRISLLCPQNIPPQPHTPIATVSRAQFPSPQSSACLLACAAREMGCWVASAAREMGCWVASGRWKVDAPHADWVARWSDVVRGCFA